MKNIVLVPFFILVPTPCANLPKSFANALFQIYLFGPFRRWRYFSMQPVIGSNTELISGLMRCSWCTGEWLLEVGILHVILSSSSITWGGLFALVGVGAWVCIFGVVQD